MSDEERMIAELLGEAPKMPDPAFRYDVVARVAAARRRRASLVRAARRFGVLTAVGLVFPTAQALGATWEAVEPVLAVATGLGVAFLFAAVSIQGPRAVLARTAATARHA